jgi:pyruvate/2-oxoglutarate/acetoin dehydrogenase E1 component
MSTQLGDAGPAVQLAVESTIDLVIRERLIEDPKAVFFGLHPPEPWIEEFGPARVRVFPICEPAMIGVAIGAATAGLHPIVDLVRSAFAFAAMDQIVNQAAKLRYLTGGQFRLPLTIRAMTRTEFHLTGQHDQSPYAMFMTPGLKVVAPGTLEDAVRLLRSAFDEPNPTIFLESLQMAREVPPEDEAVDRVPLGRARVVRPGADVTVVAVGGMMEPALEAARELAHAGIECEVIDPRTLVPLDPGTVRASVRRTRRLAVIDESPAGATVAAELIAAVVEDPATFAALLRPPVRVCSPNAPLPFNPKLEQALLPTADRLAGAVYELVAEPA